MRVSDTLTPDRVVVLESNAGLSKHAILRQLAELLAAPAHSDADVLLERLVAREDLQSTGIGQGVAVPHTSIPSLNQQLAALLIVPSGVAFEAIDGQPVNLIMGVLGPSAAAGSHLKFLARVSRLFRNTATRRALLDSLNGGQALQQLQLAEGPGDA